MLRLCLFPFEVARKKSEQAADLIFCFVKFESRLPKRHRRQFQGQRRFACLKWREKRLVLGWQNNFGKTFKYVNGYGTQSKNLREGLQIDDTLTVFCVAKQPLKRRPI